MSDSYEEYRRQFAALPKEEQERQRAIVRNVFQRMAVPGRDVIDGHILTADEAEAAWKDKK